MASYNLHPYSRAHSTTNYNYMSLDMNTLNPYNYKDLTNKLIPYQKQQDMYYFTRQLNPISLVHLGPQWMDGSWTLQISLQIIGKLYMKVLI